jgi:hypothetical protein
VSNMDEKKKLMVIGALAVAFLGIGAFQFTKGSAPAPAPAQVEKPADGASANPDGNLKTEPAEAPQANDLVSGAYAVRDPFHPLVDANAPTATPFNVPSGRVNRVASVRSFGTDIDKSGSFAGLPAASGGISAPIKPPAPEFPYKLAGIIVGRKPAAVFVDFQGAQHLVELGGALDGDTRLAYLDREHVVLRFKNQTKTLTLGGGNSSAN